MACQPPCIKMVQPCPPCPAAIPILPPGVPPLQVCPDQMCVTPVQPSIPTIEQKRRKCKYIQPARPKSYAPIRKFMPPDLEMSDHTTYRKSYLPCENDHVGPIKPKPNLCVGEGQFSKDTVNKMSYRGHKDVLPPCPILPCNHKLLGDGPMQDLTTQKHDYVPKPQAVAKKIMPVSSLTTSDCPLSDKTTNRLSYMPLDTKGSKVNAIRPIPAIEKATGLFEKNTVHKMSYMPWEPQEPVDMPWAAKKPFVPPSLRMSDDTVNRLSFAAPGTYIDCEDDDPNCVDCPARCDPNAGQQPACCLPCCCPKAAC